MKSLVGPALHNPSEVLARHFFLGHIISIAPIHSAKDRMKSKAKNDPSSSHYCRMEELSVATQRML
jgi:hypothetical protein